ncbi:MAG: META domain-containing protein [Anaerolineae bacterium]
MRIGARGLSIVLAAATLLLAVAGCKSTGATLEGTSWKLVEWTLSPLNPADFDITTAFADGRISGTSAVNSYGGAYTEGPGDAFAVGDVAMTLMAGPEPAMRAEQAYHELLRGARSFALADTTLTLYDDSGNVSLVFEAVND